uniref:Si:ch211-161f7.2 n=1 Tax=Sinocyclocheilus anshuiensis TaxID=1608454 RepID=A0A671T6Y6_9TELE
MADQTKEVIKHQTNTEMPDGNGSGCSNLYSKEQTRKTSPEFNPSNEHSVNLALKVATSFLQSVFLENRPVVLPVNLQFAGGLPPQLGETGLSPLILPASSTVSMPLVLDGHLNSQLPPSLGSCPFANIQISTLLENLLLSQPEALVYHTEAPVFQSHGTATCLQDLRPSLSNCASAEYQMTGPDQPIPLPSNFLPREIVQPPSTPMASLIPPATLLFPYPFVVPLPVPLPIPIPIPIQIPQSLDLDSKTFTKTSESGSMIDKSTRSTACPVFPHTPSVSQDEVLGLSLKSTQTKRDYVLSASPNSALDLSVVCSNCRLQNGLNTWTIHKGNGNNITHSKYEDYNGKIVCPTQTVKVIVSPTETVLPPLCDKRKGFSWDYMINSPMKPDRSHDTVPQDSSRRLSTAHSPCSEQQRQILNNKNVYFKRDRSQNMHGDTPPFKKQHLAYFLP